FFSSGRRHTRSKRDWSSDVCSSDLPQFPPCPASPLGGHRNSRRVRHRLLADTATPAASGIALWRTPQFPPCPASPFGGHRNSRRDRKSVVQGKRIEHGDPRRLTRSK